jgi:uncharacterized membrane protein
MKKNIIIGGIIGIVVILCIGGYYGMVQKGSGTTQQAVTSTPVLHNGTEVSIPVSDLSTSVKFYSYDASGVAIRYFAVKDSQGNVHVAFDACDVCYPAKKGYKQVGDVMLCLNCERQFAITSIGTENTNGGCWPSYLPMTVNGSAVSIKITDLSEKQYMFS